MRAAWLLLMPILIALLPGVASPQTPLALPPDGTPIRSITVEGLREVSDVEILRVMQLREGGQFTRAAYRNDLQAISNTGKIDPLELRILWEEAEEAPGIDITVSLKENPIISVINIVGNVRFSEGRIRTELGYDEGDIMPTGVRAATIRNLRSFYREGGYRSARVNVELDEHPEDNTVRIIIAIDEGERVKIKDLKLRGNESLSSLRVRTSLTNAPGLFFFSNYFDEMALEDDIAILRGMYYSKGFLDAHVRLGDLIYDQERKEVTVIFDITEGPRYRVSAVDYQGVTYFTRHEMDRIGDRLVDRQFAGNRMERAYNEIRTLYGNQGYIDTETSHRLIKDADTQSVEVLFVVREAPVTYVGEIRLESEDYSYDIDLNTFERFMDWFAPPIKDEAVYREVQLESGQKYRLSDEEQTARRLRNLGIFRRVDVRREPTTDPTVKDAVIELEEDPAAAFVGVTAGIGQYSGPAITIEFVQPNWGGNADRFRASATFGTRTTAYRIGFFKRYLGDSDVSMDTSIYRTTDRFRAYRQRIYGAETEFGKPLGEDLTGFLAFRAERVDFGSYRDGLETDMSGYNVFAVRPILSYDRRDNIFYPTRGYRVGGGFEAGYADGFMFKFLHSYEWYQRLNRNDLVYAYQHSVGLMPHDADKIGLSERFFVGGSGNLRGFRYKEVGPRDSGDRELAIGGATRLTQRHELRYPFADQFRGRVFTDLAILERGVLDVGRPRMGSGVGISMDLGPVTVDVDFATPVLKRRDDRAQHLHLRVGSRF